MGAPLTQAWIAALRWTPERRQLAREHAPLLALVAAFALVSVGVQLSQGQVSSVKLLSVHSGLAMTSCLMLVIGLTLHALWLLLRVPRGQRPLVWIPVELQRRYLTERRLVGCALVQLSVPVFSSAWSGLKRLIPTLNPFSWDSTFAQADHVLHAGHDPWQLLMPLMGTPWVTVATNVAYHLWYVVMLLILAWQSFSSRRAVRFRFFMTFFLLWAIPGTLVATVFSSAGPCFFDGVTQAASPYLEQFAYLNRVDAAHGLPALALQHELWEAHVSGAVQLKSGISAMPSMHVCMATLFCLVGFARSRWLGLPLAAFALWIQLGSVHLGWHYAVDGYVAAGLTLAIWWGVGRGMRAWGLKPTDLPERGGPPAEAPSEVPSPPFREPRLC